MTTERQVILEERNQRTDSDPGALFGEQMTAAQYLNHPYGIPIIGWRHEMEQLTREDALAFLPDQLCAQQRHPGRGGRCDTGRGAGAGRDALRPACPRPPIAAARAPVRTAATGRTPAGDGRCARGAALCRSRSYLAPERNPGDQQQAAALTVLAELLGGSRHHLGPGARAAVRRRQGASMSSAFYDGTSLDQRHLRPGHRAGARRDAGRGRGGDGRGAGAVPEGRRRSGGAGPDQDADPRRADLWPRQCRRACAQRMARR